MTWLNTQHKEIAKRVILLTVGCLFSYFIYRINSERMVDAYYNGQNQGFYNSQRVLQLDSLISLNDNDYRNDVPLYSDIDVHGQLFYMILSEIGARCEKDAMSMMITVQILCTVILMLFYPLEMYLLTDKMWLGIISPLLLYCIHRIHFFNLFTDTYYAQPWSILFAFPLLLLICEKRKWDIDTVIAGLSVIGSMLIANIIRASSGITILILWSIVVGYYLLKIGGRKQKAISIGMWLLAWCSYFNLENMIVSAISRLCPSVPMVTPASPWHAIWCGLGYKTNDYGFEWNDWAAYARAAEVLPGVANYSEEYYEILKKDCIEVFKLDPMFVIMTYLNKFVSSIKYVMLENSGMGIKLLSVSVLLLVIMMLHKKYKGGWIVQSQYYNKVAFWWLLFGIMGIIGGVSQGVVGSPDGYVYLLGGYVGVGCLVQGFLFYIILLACDWIPFIKV